MEENSVIELVNDEKYLVLDKIILEDIRYLFCIKLNSDESVGNKNKFFKYKKENNDYFVVEETDINIITKLKKIIKNLSVNNF